MNTIERHSGTSSLSRRSKKKFQWEIFKEFLCVLPALALILLLAYYPIAELLRISFTDWNLIKPKYNYVGFKNWLWIFQTLSRNHVLSSFIVTLKFTVGMMVSVLVLGLLLALLMKRLTRGFAFMRSIMLIPHYIGMSTSALIFLVILNERFGVANYMLTTLFGTTAQWLSNGNLALWMMIVIASWRAIGYDMLIYLSGMQGISPQYYEAAMLDGASGPQIFFKITLPMLAPTTVFLAVTQFISSMKVFALADVLTGGGPYFSTEVIIYKIYSLAFEDYRVDRASVVAILFFLFLLLVTRLTMKVTDRRVNYDA